MLKVLIVDDAMFIRAVLKKLLTEEGCEIVGEAATGKEAIQKYKILKPDVVTMDITMPDMDGVQAVREIIAIDKHAKVIMVSAMGQKSMVLDAVRAGATEFIVKPFEAVRVKEALAKVTSARG